MGNDPVNLIDPSGGIGIPCPGTSSLSIFLEGAFYAAGHALEGLSKVGTIISIASFTTQTATTVGNMIGASEVINGQMETIGVGFGNAQSKDPENPNYWILYDGTQVTIYNGIYGDTKNSRVYKAYQGTSGEIDHQYPSFQKTPDLGPVPEGDYKVSLRPSFTRKVQTFIDKNGDIQTSGAVGVQLLPWDKNSGISYGGWGQWRARLEKVKVKNTRDNFYFHDSYKGESHGCIETDTELYYDLAKFKRAGMPAIKVKIDYPDSNQRTNGGTLRTPRPWEVQNKNGLPFPEFGKFPDKKRL